MNNKILFSKKSLLILKHIKKPNWCFNILKTVNPKKRNLKKPILIIASIALITTIVLIFAFLFLNNYYNNEQEKSDDGDDDTSDENPGDDGSGGGWGCLIIIRDITIQIDSIKNLFKSSSNLLNSN